MNTDKIYAESIANQYAPKDTSKVVALRKLDRKAKQPSEIFAYTFGILSTLFALKIIDMADTLVSVLTLQNTMVTVFGSGESTLELTAYTSGAIFLALLVFTAVLMRKGAPGKKEP